MNIQEIEIIAHNIDEMPEGLNTAEQLLFLTLRELYKNFRSGAITRDRGHREKQRIIVAYGHLQSEYALMDHHRKIRKRLEGEIGSLYKCGCKNCQKMIEIFTGVDRRDPPDGTKELQEWNDKLRELVRERTERAGKLRTIIDSIQRILDEDMDADAKVEKIQSMLTKITE